MASRSSNAVQVQTTQVFTGMPKITKPAFEKFRQFLFDSSGISLGAGKETMVQSRLGKRLRHYGLECFDEYFSLVESGQYPEEYQVVLNLLSTNETYFFRESEHFKFLAEHLRQPSGANPFRIWSAASSTGEEAYSIAMLLADKLGPKANWEVIGTDINTEVIKQAASGHYRMERIDGIPKEYLRNYCLKGTGEYDGTLLIDRALRSKVHFQQVNLMHPMPALGMFDFIFLRNVLIYFDQDTKAKLIPRLVALLKPDGYFITGHSESIKGLCKELTPVGKSINHKAK